MPDPTKAVGLDLFPVTADESVELVIHHLKLAAAFYMNTPDDGGKQLQEEIVRQIEGRSIYDKTDPVALAAREFLISLIDYNESIKHEDDNDKVARVLTA